MLLHLALALAAPAAAPDALACTGGPPRPGVKSQCSLPIADAASRARRGPPEVRHFELYLPNSTAAKAPPLLPIMMHFHGQHVGPPAAQLGDGPTQPYEALADILGFVVVFPLGMDDVDGPKGKDCGTGWNVAGAHAPSSCVLAKAKSASCCYTSCRQLGVCAGDGALGNCSWSTCHDDVLFVKTLLAQLRSSLPGVVSPSRAFATGDSNGGMLTFTLASDPALASTFEAIVPVYGGILQGQLGALPTQARIMTIHGRKDTEIPVAGGEARDGWLYTPERAVLEAWARARGCWGGGESRPFPTPFDATLGSNLTCVRWDSCAVPTVVQCLCE